MRKVAILLFIGAFLCSFAISAYAYDDSTMVWGRYGRADNVYSQVSTEEKVVALTFDDGPHPKYTEEILDILKEYDIKATFFVIGKNVQYNEDIFKRCASEGHEIGNHTFTHAKADKCSYSGLKDEIEKTENVIFQFSGRHTKVFRPPTGLCDEKCVALSNELGFKTIVWNIDTKDWMHTSSDKIVSNVLSSVKNGAIILFHDYIDSPSPTPEALRRIIPKLIANGYSFMTVSELLELEI